MNALTSDFNTKYYLDPVKTDKNNNFAFIFKDISGSMNENYNNTIDHKIGDIKNFFSSNKQLYFYDKVLDNDITKDGKSEKNTTNLCIVPETLKKETIQNTFSVVSIYIFSDFKNENAGCTKDNFLNALSELKFNGVSPEIKLINVPTNNNDDTKTNTNTDFYNDVQNNAKKYNNITLLSIDSDINTCTPTNYDNPKIPFYNNNNSDEYTCTITPSENTDSFSVKDLGHDNDTQLYINGTKSNLNTDYSTGEKPIDVKIKTKEINDIKFIVKVKHDGSSTATSEVKAYKVPATADINLLKILWCVMGVFLALVMIKLPLFIRSQCNDAALYYRTK